jgi:hypothetical protein
MPEVSGLKEMIKQHKGLYSAYRHFIYPLRERLLHHRYLKDGDFSSKLALLKNCATSTRCFLIGNGPSLRIEDLDRLEKEVTFASNFAYSVFDKTRWRPTYYCLIDQNVLFSAKNDLLPVIDVTEASFFDWSSYRSGLLPAKIAHSAKTHLLYFKALNLIRDTRDSFLSSDISSYVANFPNVLYYQLQLAVYMGYKKIYLLGIDLSYPTSSAASNHADFMTGYKDTIEVHPDKYVDDLFKYLEYVDSYAKRNEFRIYNATRGGKLEAFERVAFDDIF